MNKTQRGFAVVEGLLVLVIIGILAGAGWYVVKSKKITEDSLNKTSSAQVNIPAKKTVTRDESSSWYLYESPGKEYKIRLADGWKLQRYSTSDNIYAWSNSDISYKKGTTATVEQIEGGRDGGNVAFTLRVVGGDESPPILQGTKQISLKTTQGLDIEKYIFKQTTEPESQGLQKDSTEYHYIVSKGSRTIDIYHDEALSDPPSIDIVEKVIKTLEL
jgi:type II secretory pathway pseudopilin PulG